jgi:hypothetical protein
MAYLLDSMNKNKQQSLKTQILFDEWYFWVGTVILFYLIINSKKVKRKNTKKMKKLPN